MNCKISLVRSVGAFIVCISQKKKKKKSGKILFYPIFQPWSSLNLIMKEKIDKKVYSTKIVIRSLKCRIEV